jgi:TM2 domain-containing membrane protein YozV
MNRTLSTKGITAKVALKDACLHILLESAQVPDQQSLVAFVRKGITNLEIISIEWIKIYGKCLNEEIPMWNQELELAGRCGQNEVFTFEQSDDKQEQLKSPLAQDVLEQFMNLKARTAIGISYIDMPPVLGTAKLAVQKFERSPDSKVCLYITDLIKKIMLYYETSLDCLRQKINRSSTANAIFIGLDSLTGIGSDEPIGKLMESEFPNVPRSTIHGMYAFDSVLTALWLKAGELTDELDEILNKPIDLETLKFKKIEVTAPSSTSDLMPEVIPPVRQAISPSKTVTSHSGNANKRIPAAILALLLGTLGIHKFFLGYTKEGVIMLLVTLFTFGHFAFVVAIISIVEGIVYLTKTDHDFIRIYITSRKGWF